MKWDRGESRDDVEDRRGQDGGGGGGGPGFGGGGGGGFGGLPIRGMHLSLGSVVILGILFFVFRSSLFSGGGQQPANQHVVPQQGQGQAAGGDELADFATFVLNDVQRTWDKVLPAQTQTPYRHAKLVLFTHTTVSGCGQASEEMGPFYCPTDAKVYLDLGFYDELRSRFGAPGDFAEAYVIAHEVGHHVQDLLGLDKKMRQMQSANPSLENKLSVAFELQADCLAGVWAKSTEDRKILDPGDVDEALTAAAAVGDDRLQKQAGRSVNPETWTHGSSAMRQKWFKRGMASGNISDCDTLTAQQNGSL